MNKVQTPSHEVVIIGAGIAGLTTALHLAERGLKPVILEADEEFVGGRVAGGGDVEVNGWRFRQEHGIHGIWSPYKNLQAMLARHQIRPRFVPALEEEWIYRTKGRVKKAPVGTAIRYSPLTAPLHYLNLFARPRFLRMLSIRDWLSLPLVWGGLMWGVGVDPLAENQPLGDLRLDYLVKHWAPAVRAFFVGLARNGFSATPEEIPLSGFIGFLRFYTLMRRDSWAFSYMPMDGGTSLAEPLAKAVKQLGAEIRLGASVIKVNKNQEGWQIDYTHANRGRKSSNTAQVIFATDAPNTAKIIEASPALETSQELFWPQGLETAVVRIWYDTVPQKLAEGGIFTGEFTIHNFFWLHIIQDQYRRWHRETGGSAIEVHIYGPPEVLREPDAALISRATSDVQAAYPELRGHRIHQTLQRNSATHTMFAVGNDDQHLGIKTPWESIFCCGDWVRDPTPAYFLERACITGIFAANQVLKSIDLQPWPTLSYPAPEKFVKWIETRMKRGREKRVKYRKKQAKWTV
jgi:isorenieratene synthase